MYEPYGEEKKVKIDLEKVREDIREKIKNLKLNKLAAVIIVIVILGLISGYKGYTSFTTKVIDANSEIEILERQLDASQIGLTTCQSGLQNAQNDLSSEKTKSQQCESNLEGISTDLETCFGEKEGLENDIEFFGGDLTKCETDLEETTMHYYNLQDDHQKLECNFARDICDSFGFKYYFIDESGDIICCLRKDPDFCGKEPVNPDKIKSSDC